MLPVRQPPTADRPNAPVTWSQGEHVAIVGDTGTGKTTLMAALAAYRSHVIVLRTKIDSRHEPAFEGFKYADSASVLDDPRYERIILTPKYREQGKQAYAMFEKVWQHGRWCVMIDELFYVDQVLHLRSMVDMLLTQGRGSKITVVTGMQRPSFVSRFSLSQITHLFSFRVEKRDLKTLRDAYTNRLVPLIDPDSPQVVKHHEFAYYNRTRTIVARGSTDTLQQIISRPSNP